MKLLFVIESLHIGGAEKSLVTLLKNISNDYQIDLLIFNTGGKLENDVPKNVNIIRKGISISPINRLLFRLNRIIKKPKHNAQLFRKYGLKGASDITKNYDVAIGYNQGFATYFVSEKVVANKKIAWINVDYQKAGYEIEKDIKFYKKFDTIVTVSKPAHDSFVNALQSINEQNISPKIIKDITEIRDVISKSNEFKPNYSKESQNIVTVGRLAKAKGYDLAIKATKLLKEKGLNFHWHIIGGGPEQNELEDLIHKNNVESYVTLHGSQTNPYPYVKNADIYVQTSKFEGLGLSVIEATILKKPIITTNFSTASTIIEQGETGIICEMNPKSISASIEKLLSDKELQIKFIDNLDTQADKDKEQTLLQIKNLLK